MPNKPEVVRRQERRVLRWSLGVAVVLHLGALFLITWDRPGISFGPDGDWVEFADGGWGALPVRVFFSPPAIQVTPDSVWQEPAGRVLSTQVSITPPSGCDIEDWAPTSGVGSGVVHVRVRDSGHAEAVAISTSAGSYCWDAVLSDLAGDLLYRWLPSGDFPAPVDVFQPLTVTIVTQ